MPETTDTATDSAASDAAERTAFLAELSSSRESAPPQPAAKKKAAPSKASSDEVEAAEEPSEEKGVGTSDEEAPATEADAEPEPDAEADPEAEEEATEETPADADPDQKRRLEAVQRAERRSKEQLVKREQAMHAEVDARVRKLEQEWAPRIQKAERFEAMQANARTNLISVLRELGLTDDDMEWVSKEAFVHSRAAGVKPEHRAEAARASRERDLEAKLAATDKRFTELESKLQRQVEESRAEAEGKQYLASIEKAATSRVKQALAKAPVRARNRLAQVAIELMDRDGARPEPAAVLAEYEKELEELGIAPAATTAKPKVATAPGKVKVDVGEKKNGVAAKASGPKTEEEEREEFLAEMKRMREPAA